MQENEYEGIMQEVQKMLAGEFSNATYKLWFSSLILHSVTEKCVVVLAPSIWKRDIIRSKYIAPLTNHFSEVLGFDVVVDVQSSEDPPQKEPPPKEKEEENLSAYERRFHSSYTFQNFVVGKSNELAQRASLAVAQQPGKLNNPLFLYGPSGLGKTHLLFAILNETRRLYPNSNTLYVTCEEFTNELINSLAQKSTAAFRKKYRSVDMLLVDDVQFLENKLAVQEEFFYTYNALYESNMQLILASDRPPREIMPLEERLRSRFESGLIADIQAPDLELRIAIFKRKSADMGLLIPYDVLLFLAENIKTNIRQIEGALKKLQAQSFITGESITLEMAQSKLGDFLSTAGRDDDIIDKIFKYVGVRYGVSIEDLKSSKRNATIVFPRHVAIYMVRTLTKYSLKSIARLFCRKDHTSIMNSITVVTNKCKTEQAFNRELQQACDEILESQN